MQHHRVSGSLAILVALLAGCAAKPGIDPPVPSPTPGPTRAAASVTLPPDWDLPFPPGTVIEAVNWGDPQPDRDRVQVKMPTDIDRRGYFKKAFEARGLTIEENVTDNRSYFIDASREGGGERFGVEVTRAGPVMVTRWRALR